MDLADVYRIFHPNSVQFTFFSAAHGTFSKINHILGYKASLSKYKKIEIILCILFDHNALKLEINNKNSSKKHTNNCWLNSTLLNDEWVTGEIKEEIKRLLEVNENENESDLPEPTGHSKGSPKRQVYSIDCIYQKDRKISNQ
jgi:hypothetical protein